MKRSLSSVLAGLMVIQSAPLFAQNNTTTTPIPVIVGGGSGQTQVTSYNDHGNYDISKLHQDLTATSAMVFATIKDAQKIDRDYLQGLVDSLTSKLNDLSNLKLKFQTLSQESQIGRTEITVVVNGKPVTRETVGNEKFVKLSEYAQLVREINNKDQIIQNEMATLSNMTRESLPSYEPASAGGKEIKGINAGNVNTKPLVEKTEAKRAQIIADLNGMQFSNLLAARNQTRSITENALNPNLAGLSVLEDGDRRTMQKKVKELRILTSDTTDLFQDMTDKIVNMVNLYINNYGTENWYRSRGETDIKAAREAYENIVEAFRKRSYNRRTRGPMGAMQSGIDYEKQPLNWDKYGLQYQPLKIAVQALKRTSATTEEDVMKAFENARLFLELYDEKTTEVFGKTSTIKSKEIKKEDYASPNTGFLVRANSTVTFITGQTATAETLLAIMRLVLEDAREEMVLYKSGREELIALSDSHFRATPALKENFGRKTCQSDWAMPSAAWKALCNPLGYTVQPQQLVSLSSKAGFANIYSDLLSQYKNVEHARWLEAETIQKLLEADKLAGTSAEQKQIQDEADSQNFIDQFK